MRSPPETNSQVADVSILVSSCPSCYCHSSAGTTQALCLEPARHPSWREAIGRLNLFLTCSSSLKQTMTMPRVLCLESFNHGHLLWSLDVDRMNQRIPEYLFSTGPASQNTCAWTPGGQGQENGCSHGNSALSATPHADVPRLTLSDLGLSLVPRLLVPTAMHRLRINLSPGRGHS